MEDNIEKRNNKVLMTGVILYAIGNFGTKILTFLIVPLYTYYINTSDMGNYDLLITTVSLLSPLISLRISEATYNWMIRNIEKDELCIKATYDYLIKSCFLSVVIMIIAGHFLHIWNLALFLVILVLDPVFETTQKILRGFKNQKLFAISGILYTGILVILNLLTVCIWHLGVRSLLINTIISQIFCIVFIHILEKKFRCINIKTDRNELNQLQKEMLRYSLPLVPSSLSWWVMSVSDRYVIKLFMGNSYNGIYAIATKFPSVFQTIFTLFNNAWMDMALANLDLTEKNRKYTSDIFEKMYMFSFSFVLCLIPATKIITQIILSESYKIGSIYIGFLYLGSVFQGLSSFVSVGYLQSKKTGKAASSSVIGALANLIINLCLIKNIGLFAASISTFLGFFIMWVVRMYDIRAIWPITVRTKKFIPMLLLCVIVATATIWTNIRIDFIITFVTAVLFIVINRNYLRIVFKRLGIYKTK